MKKKAVVSSRRDVLRAASVGLVAAAVPSIAGADDAYGIGDELREGPESGPKPVYLHGCGWNHDLPGVFGELCLTFEMRALLNGTGVGTFRDDVHPEVNSQFEIKSAKKQGNVFTFKGQVVSSRDPSMVGMAVKIVAEKTGKGTGKASITVGSEEQDLVVIAIIAILIGLLVPAVQ